jgi:hypothetical protein
MYTVVGGGHSNRAKGEYSTVGGGHSNEANGYKATISGGSSNSAPGRFAGIGGGGGNSADDYATVAGGWTNDATGEYSTVPGGKENTAAGDYSLAAGRRAKVAAGHNGAILFADGRNMDFDSAAANEFAARCTGGARFVSAVNGSGVPTAGVDLAAGGGSWGSISDRNAKTEFVSVDKRQLLERLAKLPITTWRYKAQDASVRHIGPVAQDFRAAFGVGEDDKRITTVDADGVALGAIQGLHELVKEKDAQIAAQDKEIAALRARLERIEAMMTAPATTQNGGA